MPDASLSSHEAVRILRKEPLQGADHHAHGPRHRSDTILRPLESGAQRLCHQALPLYRAACARPRPASPARETSEDAIFTIGPYTRFGQAFRSCCLIPKGSRGPLPTEKETSILRATSTASGQRPVSRGTLLQESLGIPIRGGHFTHTLETHIYRLRQKIEHNAAAPTTLVTEAGGYKLLAALDRDVSQQRSRIILRSLREFQFSVGSALAPCAS